MEYVSIAHRGDIFDTELFHELEVHMFVPSNAMEYGDVPAHKEYVEILHNVVTLDTEFPHLLVVHIFPLTPGGLHFIIAGNPNIA